MPEISVFLIPLRSNFKNDLYYSLGIDIYMRNEEFKRRFAAITAIGGYVPENRRTNEDLGKISETSDEWIMQRTGIKERRILEDGLATSDMIVEAVFDLLRNYPKNIQDVDALIVATSSPDMLMPSTANILAEKLGLENVTAFDVNAACSGFLHVLDIGAAFVESGRHKNVLVIGADKISAFVDIYDRSTNILFGDGAGVVWLEPSEKAGVMDSLLLGNGKGTSALNIQGGGSLFPLSEELLSSNMRFIKQDGKVVFKQAIKAMSDACLAILKRNNLGVKDIAWLVPHQANKRIIDAVGKEINIDSAKTMVNIEKFGNTISATIPLCIWENRNKLKTGDLVLLTAFGAGFTWGASLLEWAI